MPARLWIREGWHDAGKVGVQLSDPIWCCGMEWTVILWDGEDEPDLHKTHGLVNSRPKKEKPCDD